jgi:hypothetical protein
MCPVSHSFVLFSRAAVGAVAFALALIRTGVALARITPGQTRVAFARIASLVNLAVTIVVYPVAAYLGCLSNKKTYRLLSDYLSIPAGAIDIVGNSYSLLIVKDNVGCVPPGRKAAYAYGFSVSAG